MRDKVETLSFRYVFAVKEKRMIDRDSLKQKKGFIFNLCEFLSLI